MRLLTSFSIVLVIVLPLANCQVKVRISENDLIIPTKEPQTKTTSEAPHLMKRRRRKPLKTTIHPHLKVAPTEPRITVGCFLEPFLGQT